MVQNFRQHFDILLNASETNKGTRTRYEELIFQTAEPECREPDLEEIEDIIKNLKKSQSPRRR